jgi:signal peptidase II
MLRYSPILLLVSGIIVLDEWVKRYALTAFPPEANVTDPGFFHLLVHKNNGIAFNIPFDMSVIIGASVVLGGALLHIAYKNRENHPDISTAALVIVIGALGNLYDRIVYGFTVDYMLIGGRSAINMSDIVILSGVVWLLLASRRKPGHENIHPDEPAL